MSDDKKKTEEVEKVDETPEESETLLEGSGAEDEASSKDSEESSDSDETSDESADDSEEKDVLSDGESSTLSNEFAAARENPTTDDFDAEGEEKVVDEEPVETEVSSDRDGIVEDSIDEAGKDAVVPVVSDDDGSSPVKGIAAYFDLPDNLMLAAAHTRDSKFDRFEAYSPYPIHGMDDAMGLGRSWLPWVTFGAGVAGLITATVLQFGTMTFDWPMIIGGKPYAPVPSFVPVMFELTVLLAGCTTALVMLIAAGCFRKPFIIDREITQDRFVLWISAEDESFEVNEVTDFLNTLDPVEIRTITKGA